MRLLTVVKLSVALALLAALPGRVGAGEEPRGPALAFRVGKIVTMDDEDRVINNATLLVRDGRIESFGRSREMTIPEGYQVHDHAGFWLVPGLVDAHNHTMGSIRDLNDMVYLTNPGLRTLETIEPEGEEVRHAKTGGVTTVLLIPGSGTSMSGFGTITKTAGKTVDEVVVQSPGSLKIAQAGNPEGYWYGVRRSFMNYNIRQTLEKARRYHREWKAHESGEREEKPRYDPIWHDFRGLFEHEFVVSVHTQWYQVLMMSVLMLAREFKLRVVLDHCTFEAWKVAPVYRDDPTIYTINGPRQFYFDRTQRKMMGHAARWWQSGIRNLGINTDSVSRGGITQEDLSFQAAIACWYGWEPYPALRGITRVPAEALMLERDIGTIEKGKEAEFAIWSGDPLDPRSYCAATVIRGRIVYEGKEDRRF